MKKKLKNLYSLMVCFAIIATSITALPASSLAADAVSFEDKIIFENDVFSSSEYSLMAENNEEIPESVSVTLRFDESFSCDHEDINSDEELTAHRNELKDHYKALNEKIIAQLDLEDYADMSYSWYGPFIEYNYATYDDFIANDYDTLEDKDSAAMECVYIRSDYEPQNCANVATSTGDSYPFINALRLVEVLGSNNTLSDLDSLQYKGTGIKVGIMECWMYKNDANLTGIQHYEYGTITQPIDTQNNDPDDDHAFDVYSVLGGTSGVARGASLYFASLEDYSLFQCLNWFVSNGVNVINGSFNFAQTINNKNYCTGLYDSKTAYVDYIINNTKITYVASAGNGRDDTINTGYLGNPSTGLNVICVASNDRDRKISDFSSYLIPDSNTSRYLLKPTLTAPGGEPFRSR